MIAHPKGPETRRRRRPSAGRDAGPYGSSWSASTAACIPWRSRRACWAATTRRCAAPVRAPSSRGGGPSTTTPSGITGIGCVCRIHRRGDLPGARHRGFPPPPMTFREVLMRRLLSPDHMLDHSHLPWFPTEPERSSPSRSSRSSAGSCSSAGRRSHHVTHGPPGGRCLRIPPGLSWLVQRLDP